MEEQQIPFSRYFAGLMLTILPATLFFLWLFYITLNHIEMWDDENSAFFNVFILPGIGVVVWMTGMFCLLRNTLLGYDKQRRNRRYAKQFFQSVNIALTKDEITTYLFDKGFKMVDSNLYYRKTESSEDNGEINEFVSIQKTDEIIEIFNEVIARKEPFENAYQQKWFKKHEKHLIIFTETFDEMQKKQIFKQCYKWKSSAGLWVRQMPNEFWSPLVYVTHEEKLYHIPFMTSRYKIRQVVGKKIIRNKQLP